jgi:hypothetical protein
MELVLEVGRDNRLREHVRPGGALRVGRAELERRDLSEARVVRAGALAHGRVRVAVVPVVPSARRSRLIDLVGAVLAGAQRSTEAQHVEGREHPEGE